MSKSSASIPTPILDSKCTANNNTLAIKDASAPFNHPDADLILRSSDNVDFRVFKVLMSLASPVFKDMFGIPQAPAGMNNDDIKDGLSIVRMSEGSKTLQTLLIMCYPMTLVNPLAAAPATLEDVTSVLEAALKFDVTTVEERAREWLIADRFLQSDPVMVYAIACQRSLEKEARAAATRTVGISLSEKSLGKELDIMSTRELHALYRYTNRCNKAMRRATLNFDLGLWNYRKWVCDQCGGVEVNTRAPTKWLNRYLQGVSEAIFNENWNATEKERLVEIAVQEARKCPTCSVKASARVKEFHNSLLKERLEEVISEITLEFEHR